MENKPMTDDERRKLIDVQQEVKHNHQQLTEINSKVGGLDTKLDMVMGALTGNGLTKDGGIVQQVKDNKLEIEKLWMEFDSIKEMAKKVSWQTGIMWAGLGIAGGCIITFIISIVLKK